MTRRLTPARLDEIEAAAKKAIQQIETIGREAGWADESMVPATRADKDVLALVAEVRELRADLAMLRDADQDASGRFAMAPHLEPKWHPKLRHLMREREQAISERDDAKADLAEAKREVRKLRAKIERTRVQAQQVLNKHSDGPYGVGASDQAYLTIKALGEEA